MNSDTPYGYSRRGFLQTSGALGLALAVPGLVAGADATSAAESEGAVVDRGQKSGPGFDRIDTAVVFIDPQNDVLSEKGTAWAAVGESVRENKTVENMERIFRAAKQHGFEVFISPHYFYPTNSGWKFNGPLESSELSDKTFARRGALTLDGFSGSGADWLERFKPYIDDGRTVVVSPPPRRCAGTIPRACRDRSGEAVRWRSARRPPISSVSRRTL